MPGETTRRRFYEAAPGSGAVGTMFPAAKPARKPSQPESVQDQQTHLYVHFDVPDAPKARAKVRDRAARDQPERVENGAFPEVGEGGLLCRLQQDESGDWHGIDANGRDLEVSSGDDGALEVRLGNASGVDRHATRLRDQGTAVAARIPTGKFGENALTGAERMTGGAGGTGDGLGQIHDGPPVARAVPLNAPAAAHRAALLKFAAQQTAYWTKGRR